MAPEDGLVEALEDFVQDREGSVADRTFRAVMEERMGTMQKGLERVASRQDAMLIVVLAGVVAQLLVPLFR